MGRLAGFSGREVSRIAEINGWNLSRIRGSHRIYSKTGNVRNLSIPNHTSLGEGILRDLLTTMGLSVEEFLAVAWK